MTHRQLGQVGFDFVQRIPKNLGIDYAARFLQM